MARIHANARRASAAPPPTRRSVRCARDLDLATRDDRSGTAEAQRARSAPDTACHGRRATPFVPAVAVEELVTATVEHVVQRLVAQLIGQLLEDLPVAARAVLDASRSSQGRMISATTRTLKTRPTPP